VRLLTYDQVLDRVDLSRSQVSNLVRADKFPRPVDLGARVGFVEGEVNEWIAARIKERDENGEALRAERSRRGTEAVLKRWAKERDPMKINANVVEALPEGAYSGTAEPAS